MPTIMPKVMRSRRSCRNSFRTIAHQRWNENHERHGPRARLPTRRAGLAPPARLPVAEVVGRALHQVDEHVLEPGVDAARCRYAAAARSPRAATLEQRRVLAGHVQRLAEGDDLLDARHRAQPLGQARRGRGPRTANVVRPWRGDDLAHRALRHQPAVGDVGELVAALGLVHVVRADQHRDAVRREAVQLFPEFAPRVGVDARGRLVEQQQSRPVQHARGEREALLPAARQRARRAGRARPSRPRSSIARSTAARAIVHLVDARDEVEVLADRQVFPEREALRHVADVALDRRRIACGCRSRGRCPLPESGVSRPHMMRIDVVLPLPFGPRKPKISPRSTCSDRSTTTCLSPKRLFRPWTSMTAVTRLLRRSLQTSR